MTERAHQFVEPWIAGKLLGFKPPTAINAHARDKANRGHFLKSTPGVAYALADLNAHPLRQGSPITPAELDRVEHLYADTRAGWNWYKSARYRSERARRALAEMAG